MTERLRGRVENLSVIKNISDGFDMCVLRIDFDEVYLFGDSKEYMEFIGQDVVYSTRPDMVDGEIKSVICELTQVQTVQTVKSIENIKLVPGKVERTICNYDSKSLRQGDSYTGCIALMSGYRLGTSPKSTWFDCELIDQNSRACEVRVFSGKDYTEMESILSGFVGHYVRFDLEMTRFGPQTKEICGLNYSVECSPEVEIAKSILMAEMEKDIPLKTYNKFTGLMDTLESRIDGEPGYMLVRMASEIYMINAIDAISTDLDITAMKRAVFCSRGYCSSHNKNWSRPMLNTNKAMRVQELKEDEELMFILDVLCEEEASPTKLTYIKIRNLVNDIIDIRRGVINEKDNIAVGLSDTVRGLGGLL